MKEGWGGTRALNMLPSYKHVCVHWGYSAMAWWNSYVGGHGLQIPAGTDQPYYVHQFLFETAAPPPLGQPMWWSKPAAFPGAVLKESVLLLFLHCGSVFVVIVRFLFSWRCSPSEVVEWPYPLSPTTVLGADGTWSPQWPREAQISLPSFPLKGVEWVKFKHPDLPLQGAGHIDTFRPGRADMIPFSLVSWQTCHVTKALFRVGCWQPQTREHISAHGLHYLELKMLATQC